MHLTDDERRLLLGLALESIEFGLRHQCMMSVEVFEYSDRLRSQRASFVTLHSAGELLGCIGTLRPHRALVADVAHNAYQAAFNDPRFPALTQAQLLGLDLHISVLTPLEPLAIESKKTCWRSCGQASMGWCSRTATSPPRSCRRCGRACRLRSGSSAY